MKKITFYQVTDTHTICPDECKDDSSRQEALCRLSVLDTVYNQIIADKETETVIISGDVANHGRFKQHQTFVEHTQRLLDAGKKVCLITATHDFGLTKVFPDGKSEELEDTVNRCRLGEMYKSFGPSTAVAQFDSYSYVAKPCDGFRILCMNDDGDGTKFRGYSEEQKQWIVEQVKAARDNGDYIFAVTHHPVIPPSPVYPVVSKSNMIGDYENTAKFFADNGIKFVFTGHTHMQSIRSITTESGNVLYDINTGTISEFPLAFRKVTIFDNGEADVQTVPVGVLPFNTEGKAANLYFSEKFTNRLLTAIDAMENNYDFFASEIGSLAVEREKAMKLKKPLTLVGKVLNRITIGEVCKLLLCPFAADKSIKDKKFKLLLVDIMKNIYAGDEPYSPSTPEYKVLMEIVSRVELLLKKKLNKPPFDDLKGFVEGVIYDPTPDSNAYLK